MGFNDSRRLAALLLLLALPAGAQGERREIRPQLPGGSVRGAGQEREPEREMDNAMGRLQWFRERMGGDLGPAFARHLLREAEKERTKRPAAYRAVQGPEKPVAVNGATWVSLGPTSADFIQNGLELNKVDSGRLRTILPDTADATGNTLYLLASGGGLWKTTNLLSATPAWTPLTDFVGSNMSGAAAFGRSTSILFVGAGDPFDAGVGGFMIKSVDGGASWSPSIQLGSASKIYDIQVDASQAQDIVLAGTNAGLYRSADAGASYQAVASIPAAAGVWSLVRTSAGWIASAATRSGNTTSGSLYLSTDRGATWSPISTAFTGAGRITLGVGQPGDTVVYAYAAAAGDGAQLDLFRSPDGGLTWTALGITRKAPQNPNADNSNLDLMAGQPWYNHMLLVDPADSSRNTVYLGGQLASAKTTDGGATWTLLTNWLGQYGLPYVHADFHCAAILQAGSARRLCFGTDGGLFISADGGATWDDSKNKGLVNHLVYTLAANPGVPGSALVGMQDNGTRIRDGITSTFNQVRGGDGFGVAWAQDVTGPSAVSMCSFVYNAIRRATTSPVTDQSQWVPFTDGLGATGNSDGGNQYYFVTPLASCPAGADPTGQIHFTYGRTGTIYQSDASAWTLIGNAGSGGISAGRTVRAVSHGIGVSPVDRQRIAAAGTGGYLLLTANGGSSWTEVFLGAVDANGSQMAGSLVPGWKGYNANIAWANNNLLYVCSESPLAGSIRIAKSANGGTTWAASAGNLPDIPVTKLAVDPGDGTGNTVYAATWLGVYRTTDGGATWSVFGTGLPQGRVTDLWVAPDSSSLRAATWGRGIWEMVNTPLAGTVSITPTSALLYPGETATFNGTVNGGGTVRYTATGGTITTGGIFTAGNTPGDFTVTAANAGDLSKNATANVTVVVPVPVAITTQPTSRIVAAGHTTTFTIEATGTGPLTFQWKRDGTSLPGATTPSYTTPALDLNDSGSVFTCEVSGRSGTVASVPAALTVAPLAVAVTSNSTEATNIPDNPGGAIEIPFTVSNVRGKAGEVEFSLYLTHTYPGDLVLTLISPDGTSVVLSNAQGGSGLTSPSGAAFGTSCGTYLTFSDLAATSIADATAPPALVGSFRPSAPLDAFNGKEANGTWKLRILDTEVDDTGTFRCGLLSVKPFALRALDVNGDGAMDLRDLLFFAKNYATDTAACDLDRDGAVNDDDLGHLLAGL